MKSMKTFAFAMLALLAANTMNAQCIAWTELSNADDIESAHVLYKDAMDTYDITADDFTTDHPGFQKAMKFWKTAYEAAPAANGDRSDHYADGVDFYLELLKGETDPTKQEEYKATIYRLYDEHLKCYPAEEGTLMAYKASNMFYYLRAPYSKLLETLDRAYELKGNDVSYGVIAPYGAVAVYNFKQGRMEAEAARAIYENMNKVADAQLEKDGEFASYYDDARKNMNAAFAEIASDIFDCDFFKGKYEPLYRDSSDNFELIQKIYLALKDQGCPADDAFVMELKGKYDVLVKDYNETKEREFNARNPGAYARKLYLAGDYQGALAKYEEAINAEKAGDNDSEKLATYYFSQASIKGRKLKQYSAARSLALKAAKLKPNWGKPYLLIGDLYASSTRSCGKEPWQQRMVIVAAIDKYAYAKSIDSDPEVVAEANKKIGKYSAQKPEKGDVFMAGYKVGGKYKIGCWINETVKIRVQ